MQRWQRTALTAGLATALATAPAMAQKSKDTIRMGLGSPIKGISYYFDPTPDTTFESPAVYDGLVGYDEDMHTYDPLLAKSWKRVSPTAIEFSLRDDVKWHDGERFDADDVVYTFNWLTHPKTKLRFKRNWAWIAKVEKLGSHKVRITAKRPTPFDLARYAYFTAIVPEHLHGKLKDKSKFGRNPVGTGMFRVTQVDQNKGIVMVRNDAYKHGGKAKPVTNFKRLVLLPIPEMGTQIAQFLAGKLDVVGRIALDQAQNLAKRPNVKMTVSQGMVYIYMAIDAKGRSGIKPLQDIRVRKALLMAVDRGAIRKLVAGERPGRIPRAMCWKFQVGCDFDVPLPKFDPAAAKKLLAQAGHAKGFDVELTTFTSPALSSAAEVVSGQLARIGIRATIARMVMGAYRRKQRAGKIQIMIGGWPAGGLPDVTGTLSFLYMGGPRDYHGDTEVHKWARMSKGIMDPAKRRALGKKVFNASSERAYIIPLAGRPGVFVHTQDVVIKGPAFHSFNIDIWDLRWK